MLGFVFNDKRLNYNMLRITASKWDHSYYQSQEFWSE